MATAFCVAPGMGVLDSEKVAVLVEGKVAGSGNTKI